MLHLCFRDIACIAIKVHCILGVRCFVYIRSQTLVLRGNALYTDPEGHRDEIYIHGNLGSHPVTS